MANTGLGQEGYARGQNETVYGTAKTDSMILLPIENGSVTSYPDPIENNQKVGSRLHQFPSQGRLLRVGEGFEMPAYPELVGRVLNWLLGAASSVGPTDSTYVHTWFIPMSGIDVNVSHTFQQAKGEDTADQYDGGVITDMTFKSDMQGHMMIGWNAVYQGTSAGVARIASFTGPSDAPFNGSHINSYLGGDAHYTNSVEINIDMGIDKERFRLGSAEIREPTFQTRPTVTMAMNIDADRTFLDYARAYTEFSDMTVTCTHTAYAGGTTPYQLVFEIPTAMLAPDTDIPNTDNRINMDLNFRLTGGTTTGSGADSVPMEIRMKDAEASYTGHS